MDDRRWHRGNVPAARALRRPLTPTEEMLWNAIRNRGLRWKFRRQHPVGRYVLDFYCHELRLAVEVDGAVHESADARLADAERQLTIEEDRIVFLRLRAGDIKSRLSWVLSEIEQTCGRLSALTPTPLPEGEGLD